MPTTIFTPNLALTSEGQAPDWVHLLPSGRFNTRDGRAFDNAEPDAVIATFRARAIDLPIDYEHQNDRPEARLSGPVPAAGRVKDLKRTADGIWGRVEWTARAREMIAKREYRYLSPVLKFLPGSGKVIMIKGAALVHSPALHLTALASEGADMADTTMPRQPDPAIIARIAAIVGLPADSDPQDILRAVMGELDIGREALASEAPDPARFVPIEVVRDLIADRGARIAASRKAEAQAKVEAAERAGHLTGGMRKWATALCEQDPEAFDAFLAASPAPYAHLLRPTSFAPLDRHQRHAQSPDADLIRSQLGLPEGALRD